MCAIMFYLLDNNVCTFCTGEFISVLSYTCVSNIRICLRCLHMCVCVCVFVCGVVWCGVCVGDACVSRHMHDIIHTSVFVFILCHIHQ